MGAGVKYYLSGTNEIPPLLLLPHLHDQVEQVLGLLQPFNIRFLVQRSVMSSFLAIMQKTEPAVIASGPWFGGRCVRVACGPNVRPYTMVAPRVRDPAGPSRQLPSFTGGWWCWVRSPPG